MEGENLCKQLQFLSLLFFQFFQSKKKKKIETLNKKNRSSSWKETKVSFPARIESVVDGKVGRASNIESGNIFTRVIDRPPVESRRTCNPVAHACPVSRCFARASTHAMSRCHGLTQLTRVATSPSLFSRVDRAHSAQIETHTRLFFLVAFRETVHLLLPPR